MACKLNFYLVITFICIVVIFIVNRTANIPNPLLKIPILSPLPNKTTELPVQSRRFAIFSSSIHSTLRSYIFYTPITAAAWQRLGYEVIVIFVGDFTNKTNPSVTIQLNLTQAFLRRLNVHTLFLQCNKSYATKLSQLVRIFSGYLSDNLVKDDDYILTTDSDMIPIRENDYQLNANTSGFIYNAFCCGTFQRRNRTYPMYPMSHICLSKKLWRDLFLQSIQRKELLSFNLTSTNQLLLLSSKAPFSFETISLYTRHEFQGLYDSNMTKGDSAWYMDQIYVSILLNDYLEKFPKIIIDKRSKTSLRLDPGLPYQAWDPQRLNQYGDAHIIHDEIFDSYRWKPFLNLLRYLFDPFLANDFDYYYKQFTLTLFEKPDEY